MRTILRRARNLQLNKPTQSFIANIDGCDADRNRPITLIMIDRIGQHEMVIPYRFDGVAAEGLLCE
ncbi:hypothetical protein D3C79_1059960 [compost metagenome]